LSQKAHEISHRQGTVSDARLIRATLLPGSVSENRPESRIVPQRRRIAVVIVVALLAFSPRCTAGQDGRPYVVLVDRDMTPAAGTADLLAMERALADVEDRWLPPSRFDEPTRLKHALGIG
jgi:hypothetical protein